MTLSFATIVRGTVFLWRVREKNSNGFIDTDERGIDIALDER